MTENNDIEILTVNIGSITITSVYKPPNRQFQFDNSDSPDYNNTNIVIGDFNSHRTTWGYSSTDENGDLVEEWSDAHHLGLIHDPKLSCSFNSSCWKWGYNPDLSFISKQKRITEQQSGTGTDTTLVPEGYSARAGWLLPRPRQILHCPGVEDGFETGRVTFIVLVDLSAAYYVVPNSRACTAIYLGGGCSPTRPYYALHAYSF